MTHLDELFERQDGHRRRFLRRLVWITPAAYPSQELRDQEHRLAGPFINQRDSFSYSGTVGPLVLDNTSTISASETNARTLAGLTVSHWGLPPTLVQSPTLLRASREVEPSSATLHQAILVLRWMLGTRISFEASITRKQAWLNTIERGSPLPSPWSTNSLMLAISGLQAASSNSSLCGTDARYVLKLDSRRRRILLAVLLTFLHSKGCARADSVF